YSSPSPRDLHSFPTRRSSDLLGSSSGVVTPGLGFGYNDYMNCFDPRPGRPNSVRPGKTRVTMMTPTMVFDRGKLRACAGAPGGRSEEHTSELQSRSDLVCRLL